MIIILKKESPIALAGIHNNRLIDGAGMHLAE